MGCCPDRWRSLGFHKMMSLDEARVRARQLNVHDFVSKKSDGNDLPLKRITPRKDTTRLVPKSSLKSLKIDF